jgi:hypothetical protein
MKTKTLLLVAALISGMAASGMAQEARPTLSYNGGVEQHAIKLILIAGSDPVTGFTCKWNTGPGTPIHWCHFISDPVMGCGQYQLAPGQSTGFSINPFEPLDPCKAYDAYYLLPCGTTYRWQVTLDSGQMTNAVYQATVPCN